MNTAIDVERKDLYQEALSHFNEPVLMGFDLARCVGYAEDDNDCYLVVDFPDLVVDFPDLVVDFPGRKRILHTFVGGYMFLDRLKGQGYCKSSTGEEWDDFTRLDLLLALNGAPKEREFICDVRTSASPEPVR